MRLRNKRPLFPNPLLCSPRLRPHPASYKPKLDDPFLVEETSRQMGWSCYPLHRTENEVLQDDSRRRLQLEIKKEINKFFEDDELYETSAMEETSDDTSEGQAGVQDSGGGGLDTSTNNQEYKDPPIDAVNFAKVLRSVFSQEGYEHPQIKKENTSQWKTSAETIKEEPLETETKVDGRKNQFQEDAEGSSIRKKRNVHCVMNRNNFLVREIELIDLLGSDSDESTSQLSNQLPSDRRRKRKRNDDEDWAVEHFKRNTPKRRKPIKVEETTKDKSRCPEKKPQKKRGRPRAVKKRKVGRPRKSKNNPSNANNLRKKEVVERPRRRRRRAGRSPSYPILIR